jgi:hypothetical protein
MIEFQRVFGLLKEIANARTIMLIFRECCFFPVDPAARQRSIFFAKLNGSLV